MSSDYRTGSAPDPSPEPSDVERTTARYLFAISTLSTDTEERIATGELKEYLGVTPASVTEMVAKLDERGLVDYEKYQGFGSPAVERASPRESRGDSVSSPASSTRSWKRASTRRLRSISGLHSLKMECIASENGWRRRVSKSAPNPTDTRPAVPRSGVTRT
ncbi:metal-dependent transcriptional regulator [Halosimplex aquaticum]